MCVLEKLLIGLGLAASVGAITAYGLMAFAMLA